MTTEQMDSTDDRRKRTAVGLPEILYGTPTEEEIAAARGRAGSRGVLIVPEEMRGHIPEMHTDAEWAQIRDEKNAGSRPIDWADGYPEDAPKDDRDEAPAGEGHFGKEPLKMSSSDFDPPLTLGQAEQVQDFINRGFAAKQMVDTEPTETQAEEPIEDRLRRAWANGWQEGFDRGSRGDGRWDR